ncbi:hypothetical protein [Vulcanisaeta distributa]|uniref:hypothetical protein n=1 Tax=Vulcanisaeta distributa TaxID=164451 RepID=UPI000A8A5D32|nr:hypothetical protein [Vulcanisaeta distributa]
MAVNNTNSNMGDKEDEELSKLLERKARELAKAVGNEPVELSADNFDDFVRSRKVVVVDFWAPGVRRVSYLSQS